MSPTLRNLKFNLWFKGFQTGRECAQICVLRGPRCHRRADWGEAQSICFQSTQWFIPPGLPARGRAGPGLEGRDGHEGCSPRMGSAGGAGKGGRYGSKSGTQVLGASGHWARGLCTPSTRPAALLGHGRRRLRFMYVWWPPSRRPLLCSQVPLASGWSDGVTAGPSNKGWAMAAGASVWDINAMCRSLRMHTGWPCLLTQPIEALGTGASQLSLRGSSRQLVPWQVGRHLLTGERDMHTALSMEGRVLLPLQEEGLRVASRALSSALLHSDSSRQLSPWLCAMRPIDSSSPELLQVCGSPGESCRDVYGLGEMADSPPGTHSCGSTQVCPLPATQAVICPPLSPNHSPPSSPFAVIAWTVHFT